MVETELGAEHVIVTFRLDVDDDVDAASVVGDFNDWSVTANPMVRNETGVETQILLMPGRTYRFRYLLDGQRWENDWDVDAYVPNAYGSEDSVIDLRDTTLLARRPTTPPASGASSRRRATSKDSGRGGHPDSARGSDAGVGGGERRN